MFVAIFTAITIGCLAGNTRESKSIDGADRLKSIEATGQWTINLIQSTKPSIKVEYPQHVRRQDNSGGSSGRYTVFGFLRKI